MTGVKKKKSYSKTHQCSIFILTLIFVHWPWWILNPQDMQYGWPEIISWKTRVKIQQQIFFFSDFLFLFLFPFTFLSSFICFFFVFPVHFIYFCDTQVFILCIGKLFKVLSCFVLLGYCLFVFTSFPVCLIIFAGC